ncbi:MAG: ROK family protein [Candidatus Velthaea sp.]
MASSVAPLPAVAGINIGGTTTTVVSGGADGVVRRTSALPTDTTQSVEAFYSGILAQLRAAAPDAAAVGVAVGGPLDANRGVVVAAPHLPHLVGFPLRDRLMADTGLPVRVHHDAAACALAEYRWGPDAGAAGIAYLTCGTGFGAGIVLDGRARYGRDGFSPELGHVRFRSGGPDIFGKPGCYEGFGSANALALLARGHDPARFAGASPRDVVVAAAGGNAAAHAALRDNVDAVGAACALLADLLVLDVIALGTLSAYLGAAWIDAVREVFEQEALPHNVRACAVRAALPDVQDRSALAAACDALDGGERGAAAERV